MESEKTRLSREGGRGILKGSKGVWEGGIWRRSTTLQPNCSGVRERTTINFYLVCFVIEVLPPASRREGSGERKGRRGWVHACRGFSYVGHRKAPSYEAGLSFDLLSC